MNTLRNVDQVWLFGSYVRDELESYSDIDVLFISDDDCSEMVERIVRDRICNLNQLDISHYTQDGIANLISSGSLFTWHLKDEGKPLYEARPWLRNELDKMPPYKNHLQDLALLLHLAYEAGFSLHESPRTATFDAGILSTAMRNTAIILTNFLGHTDYSPHSPETLAYLEPLLRLPISIPEYWQLVECRQATERGNHSNTPKPNIAALMKIAHQIIDWQSMCVEYIQSRSK
jgi:predicted nucleotidyltransferase